MPIPGSPAMQDQLALAAGRSRPHLLHLREFALASDKAGRADVQAEQRGWWQRRPGCDAWVRGVSRRRSAGGNRFEHEPDISRALIALRPDPSRDTCARFAQRVGRLRQRRRWSRRMDENSSATVAPLNGRVPTAFRTAGRRAPRVGARIGCEAPHLLRRHGVRRADRGTRRPRSTPGRGVRHQRIGSAGQAEIHDLQAAARETMAFAALRSRCTTPRSCACASASAASIAYRTASSTGSEPPSTRSRNERPSTYSMAIYARAAAFAHLVDRADVRVVERGGASRLPEQPRIRPPL